jgi:hypothetical protein
MYRYVMKTMSDGHEVYVNLIDSSAGQYLSRQPYVLGLVKELSDSLKFENKSIFISRDMGRVIGNTEIIDTTEKDTIYYAKAYKKKVFSRFAKNRFPIRSSMLTVIFERDPGGDYELLDTWIGPQCPPFPGDERETSSSKAYWESHALVHDAQIVQNKTVTKQCPY